MKTSPGLRRQQDACLPASMERRTGRQVGQGIRGMGQTAQGAYAEIRFTLIIFDALRTNHLRMSST